MRLRLRWKIMLFTVLPLITLAFIALWVVNRSISQQTNDNIKSDLERASAVLENMLAARERQLEVAGQVIVEDPKFFSVLTIPGSFQDAQLQATVAGVARDFNRITQADVFEVFNARGQRVASVGREGSSPQARDPFIQGALAGRQMSGIVVGAGVHYQVSVSPVVAGDHIVGALMIGSHIGRELADQLRDLTRSEVTFLSGGAITGTTLDGRDERQSLLTHFSPGESGTLERADGTVGELRTREHVYLTLAQPFPQTGPDQGQVYVMQRALDAETAFLRAMQNDLVQLGIAAVLASLLAGYLIAERITSPVQRLVRGAEEMERGNYDYPLDVKHKDEIGYLAQRFGDMRERHRVYVNSLRDVARMKSEFLSVASHELRTPISVIAGFQELMRAGKLGPVTEAQRQGLDAISRSVDTLGRITEDATRMAQIESDRLALTLSDCDVSEVLQSAIDEAVNDAPGRAVVTTLDVEPGIGSFRADGQRLTQAVANLVRNGIRFTPDGGMVSVAARVTAGDLEIAVQDTGIGISQERQATLFETSFAGRDSLNHHSSTRLEFKSAGMGLGLSIARGIVLAHRGAIKVSSEPGEGTTFVITIPRSASGQPARIHLPEAA